jgi:hypothetical protein
MPIFGKLLPPKLQAFGICVALLYRYAEEVWDLFLQATSDPSPHFLMRLAQFATGLSEAGTDNGHVLVIGAINTIDGLLGLFVFYLARPLTALFLLCAIWELVKRSQQAKRSVEDWLRSAMKPKRADRAEQTDQLDQTTSTNPNEFDVDGDTKADCNLKMN